MAQLVEQLIRNEQVVGSSPTISSSLSADSAKSDINFTISDFFA